MVGVQTPSWEFAPGAKVDLTNLDKRNDDATDRNSDGENVKIVVVVLRRVVKISAVDVEQRLVSKAGKVLQASTPRHLVSLEHVTQRLFPTVRGSGALGNSQASARTPEVVDSANDPCSSSLVY